jgi:iron complex outermembrane receptor protein
MDDQVQINSAVFYYDYEDIQINRFINNASSVTNAAVAKIFGFESEFIFAPQAAENFRLSGSIGYLNSEYDDATFADPINGGPAIDVSGNELVRAPEWKFSLAAQYSFHIEDFGEILLIADAHYSDNYHFDVFEASLLNQSSMEQDSYTVGNVRAAWLSDRGDYEVMLFVENVTDEIFAETRVAVGTTGAVIGQFSAPRTWGIRFSAKFGAGR